MKSCKTCVHFDDENYVCVIDESETNEANCCPQHEEGE